MKKSFFFISILLVLCGSPLPAAEESRNSPQVVVTDNRIESKTVVFNFSVDDVEYKCTLSHKRWHQLQISPPFILREDGLAASLTGALFINEKSYQNECNLPPLFWEKLRGQTSICVSGEYMTNIITSKSQDMFLLYFQEILNLDVFISTTRQVNTLELPTHRSATVVLNFMNMK